MQLENNRIKRKRRNSYETTCVKGVRADSEFWHTCSLMAKKENTTVNELIQRVVFEYCQQQKEN